MNEEELVQRCRQGDREAQQELYAQNADRVYRLLLRMAGNADDAFELSQDAFVRVFSHLDRFDARSRLATWVYQIALNEGRQYLRRRKLQRVKLAEIDATDTAAGNDTADIRLDVTEALGQLPEEERTLLILRYYEQLSYEEIAEAMEKPVGTVGSGLNRARRLLQRQMSREDAPRA